MNPFVEKPQKAHFWKSYPSDENYHVVFVKGKNAKVSEKGSFPCPIWKFNEVAFVWLHERKLNVDLSTAKFFSSDKIAIEVEVDLIAQVKEKTDRALIAVATCFDESFELLRTDVTSIVRKFCNTRQANAIHGAEKDSAKEILSEMNSSSSSSIFTVKSASVCFRIPFLEDAAKRKVTGDITFEEFKTTETRATELDQLKNVRASVNLDAELELDAKRIMAGCAKRTGEAKTDRQIKAADLQNFKDYSEVTEKLKTAILHMKPPLPEIYAMLESARITNDAETMRKAIQEVMSMFGAVAGSVKNASAIVIEHTNT